MCTNRIGTKKQCRKMRKDISDLPAFLWGEKSVSTIVQRKYLTLNYILLFLDWSQDKEKHSFQLNLSLIRFVFSLTFKYVIIFLKIMLAESRSGQEHNMPLTIARLLLASSLVQKMFIYGWHRP